eukprot:3248259-Pleurochrysis_carterae.AAC.1
MMLVGHTHEDIDAVFRRVFERWKKKGGCMNPHAFRAMLEKAIPAGASHMQPTTAPCACMHHSDAYYYVR